MQQVSHYLRSPAERRKRAEIYGVPTSELRDAKGPSVAALNGVIASLAMVEFMAAVTGLRAPKRHLNYLGHLGRLTERTTRKSECLFCNGIKGTKEEADVERYLKIPHLSQAGRGW
jgi:hypothetical protein